MPPISPDLDQQIRQVMRDCGQQAVQMAKSGFEVSQKGPEDYVTNIDQALDRQLATAFTHLFPGDSVITEENAQSRTQFSQPLGDRLIGSSESRRMWCIDPIDGTEDFINGGMHYAVMAGALQSAQPQLGWVYAPAYDQMYCGGANWGVFQAAGDRPLQPIPRQVPDAPRPGFCPVLIGHRDRSHYGAAIADHIPGIQFYSVGSFGLKVMEVVQGRAGLYMYFNGRVKLWDTVGPLAIAQAAGLTCCDLDGNPIRFDAAAIDLATLAHKQSILVGWDAYLEPLLPKLQKSIASVP